MEKPTKNDAVAKFKSAKKKDKAAFLGIKEDEEDYSCENNMPSISACVAEANKLGGVYALVDPIDTCVGPIGRFPAVPEGMPLHPAIVAYGKRRTGKTFTTRDIFFHCFRDIPFGIVITRTKMNGFWQTYVPPAFVKDAADMTHAISTLIARQKALIEKWKKDHIEKVAEDPDCYKSAPELAAFCILDDVIADAAAMLWNTQLTSLFVEGRHQCITVAILTQYPKGVGPKIRGKCFHLQSKRHGGSNPHVQMPFGRQINSLLLFSLAGSHFRCSIKMHRRLWHR